MNFSSNLKNFWRYRDLLIELISKNIRLKYKNSVLGILWSMLEPLLTMIVLTIVFGSIFKKNIENFPVYVLIGRITYSFFSQATKESMEAVRRNKQLIKKIYVPKYFFPIAAVCSTFITYVISFIPLIIVMIITGVKLSWTNLFVIFPLIYVLLASLGIGLVLSSIRVFFGDVKHLYSVGLLMIMYMTPIFYPASIIEEQYLPFIKINPLFNIVDMIRQSLMYHTIPSLHTNLVSLSYSLLLLVTGVIFFYKTQDKFIFHI